METQNIVKQKYSPINGEFYDKLETAATLNKRCELVYLDDEAKERTVTTHIEDLFTNAHEEFAVLEDNTIIRLDRIKSFNGETGYQNNTQTQPDGDFEKKFYDSTEPVLIGDNSFYELWIDRMNNVLELKITSSWTSLDDIPELKTQLIKAADYFNESFGMLNDLSILTSINGVLEAPFIPARGILINAGLTRVADILPTNCETVVHNRGSFSVNSVKVRSFHDRYFGFNWITER